LGSEYGEHVDCRGIGGCGAASHGQDVRGALVCHLRRRLSGGGAHERWHGGHVRTIVVVEVVDITVAVALVVSGGAPLAVAPMSSSMTTTGCFTKPQRNSRRMVMTTFI
jgi:hypothetical protein